MDKKDGGTIVNWQLHELSTSPEQYREVGYDVRTDKSYILSGTVKEDPTGRWQPGFHMRSSLIAEMDLEAGIVKTQNTIYKIEGTGGKDILPDLGDGILQVFY